MEEVKDFGWALNQIKEGKAVRRTNWYSSECIFLIKGRTVEYNTFQSQKNNANQAFNPPFNVEISDHIDKKEYGDSYTTGWIPSQSDLLSTNWELYTSIK